MGGNGWSTEDVQRGDNTPCDTLLTGIFSSVKRFHLRKGREPLVCTDKNGSAGSYALSVSEPGREQNARARKAAETVADG